ncbi:MAG: response regulator [Bacteroidales bacterium]|nr:response regulator [Bacteroidales bacterium]
MTNIMAINNITQTILVVDDSKAVSDLVQVVLEERGYKTIAADNGTQAMVMAIEYRPDLILLDIMMPDIDGYTICAQLKADRKTRDIPVIFLSALNSQFDKIKAFKSGAVDFVTQPVQVEELTARVKSHLTISTLNKALQSSNRDLESLVSERTKELEESNKKLAEINARLEKTIADYRAAQERAASDDDYKAKMLSKLSHEILNDTNIIVGFSELIKVTEDRDRLCEYADCIRDSAGSLVAAINTVQEYNNVIIGRTPVNKQRVNIGAVLYSVCQKHIEKARQRNIEIAINNEFSDGAEIFTDEMMLTSILNKIISNSLKYSEKGPIEIGASNNGGTAVFYVRDCGIGIGPDVIDHVLEPFVRGIKTCDNSNKGLGLGLSIVKEYVQRLNGEIWFDSSPGVGTIFYISLPVNSNGKITPEGSSAISFDGTSVLVGEDDDVNFALLNENLRKYGVKALRAKTGKELFELYRQNSDVQMVISNLKLPMMNGSEAMKLIRKMSPSIITVAQIPYFSAEDKRAFTESGCNYYIDRPANELQVRDLLAKYLLRK